ncbi:unnamed protein product [Camellia sinensis]
MAQLTRFLQLYQCLTLPPWPSPFNVNPIKLSEWAGRLGRNLSFMICILLQRPTQPTVSSTLQQNQNQNQKLPRVQSKMSSLGTSKGILEIVKFGVYVTVPIGLMYFFANNTKNIQKFMALLCCLSPGGTKTPLTRGTKGDGSRNCSQERHPLMAPSECMQAFVLIQLYLLTLEKSVSMYHDDFNPMNNVAGIGMLCLAGSLT